MSESPVDRAPGAAPEREDRPVEPGGVEGPGPLKGDGAGATTAEPPAPAGNPAAEREEEPPLVPEEPLVPHEPIVEADRVVGEEPPAAQPPADAEGAAGVAPEDHRAGDAAEPAAATDVAVTAPPAADPPADAAPEPPAAAAEVTAPPASVNPAVPPPAVDEGPTTVLPPPPPPPLADEGDAGGGAPPPPPAKGGRRIDPRLLLGVLTVVVIGIAVFAFLIARNANRAATGNNPGVSTTVTTRPTPSDFATFNDTGSGMTIRYPADWQKLVDNTSDTGELRLALAPGPGTLDGVIVRVIPTQQVVTAENLADVKAVTDALIAPEVKVFNQQPVSINGALGYYYLYTFTDKETGLEGAHAHYFLFRGKKMHTLVFQALPIEGFQRLASTFDDIANSFTSDPSVPAPMPTEPAPTTAPAG